MRTATVLAGYRGPPSEGDHATCAIAGSRPRAPPRCGPAEGEWLVMLDSDWELLPHSLDRLRALIGELPHGVRMIRSRLQWDDGAVSPDP